jgi:hypothetical protein
VWAAPLDVPGTGVTAGGVAALVAAARNLQSLALGGSQVDAQSAAALRDREALVEIYLYGADVVDATISALAGMDQLRELNLLDTSVTGAAVPAIAALRGLRTLRVEGWDAGAVERMRAARPDVLVVAYSAPQAR